MKYELVDIESIEEINTSDEFVYDIEMDDNDHVFFANDILVHNSTHVTIQPVLDALKIPLCNEKNEITPKIYDIVNDLNKHLNIEIVNWAKTSLNSIDPRFFFKREAICPAGIYQAKKHYILHIRDKGEDKPLSCDKIKYVGVEIAKTTMSESVKSLIKRVVECMLYTRDQHKSIAAYKTAFEDFKHLTLEEIAFRSSINKYEQYEARSNAFQIGKRTPAHVVGAIYYNRLLKEFNIQNNYDAITSGNKIKWFYCLPNNRYNISKFSFIGNDIPKELKDIIQVNYDIMFEKQVSSAINRLFDCAKWKIVDFRKEYACDLFNFFGIDS